MSIARSCLRFLSGAALAAATVPAGAQALIPAMTSPASAVAGVASVKMIDAMDLSQLVALSGASEAAMDAETECLATAVYFEARGESLEGQIAVAEVVINRAASGRYPASWCAVVRQRAQFSFVRAGRFPAADRSSAAWRRARGIARLASAGLKDRLASDVLWYHADYVAPAWRLNLARAARIGTHIFYRG